MQSSTTGAMVHGPLLHASLMRCTCAARTAAAGSGTVRAMLAELAGMTDPLLDRVAARARKHAHKRHSAAYRWLREHHAELVPIFAAQRPPWREIAAELTAGGVRGGKDKALTGRALAGIWGRVCGDLAAAEATRQAAQQKARMQPSRLPAGWRPAPAQPMAPRQAPPSPAHTQDRADKDRYAGIS